MKRRRKRMVEREIRDHLNEPNQHLRDDGGGERKHHRQEGDQNDAMIDQQPIGGHTSLFEGRPHRRRNRQAAGRCGALYMMRKIGHEFAPVGPRVGLVVWVTI